MYPHIWFTDVNDVLRHVWDLKVLWKASNIFLPLERECIALSSVNAFYERLSILFVSHGTRIWQRKFSVYVDAKLVIHVLYDAGITNFHKINLEIQYIGLKYGAYITLKLL